MLATLASTLRSLRDSANFQTGAAIVLTPMLERTREGLREEGIERGRVLRGVIHLRSDDSYDSVVVHELDGKSSADTEQLTSSNVWQWVRKHQSPVEVDVLFGRAALVSAPTHALTNPSAVETPFIHGASQQMMMARGTTHLAVFPLTDERAELRGMVSIEVQARGETRVSAVWNRCKEDLGTWLQVLGPYLCALPRAAHEESPDPLLPVCGPTMAPIVRLLKVFASQHETLLLSGATGVGKSRLAQFCHAHSSRAPGPFETVDLLSVPPAMQLAELLGWKKGAFTGANAAHDGYVARAAGGTLFLDEIDKLSLDAQSGLLRLLENKRYRPLGASGNEQEADVRFIVGTNRDLMAEVREGRFREDLLYRINVLAVRVPPLSERTDEVVGWAEHMLRRRREEAGAPDRVVLTDGARELLAKSRWPGNLRQLDNVVRRAFVIALADAPDDGELEVSADHIDASMASELGDADSPIGAALDQAARALVAAAAEGGLPIELDDAGIFRAHLLVAAISQTGSLEEGLRLLKRENLVKNRNHHKTVDRELERVRVFYATLGVPAPVWLLNALAR